MKLGNIIKELEKLAPNELCEDWDNIGLMLGSREKEITAAAVALDITEKAVSFAAENKCELLVSHHPFIMPKLTSVDLDTKKGVLIETLIKNNISVYSMHTNFDSAAGGINDTLCEIFGLIKENDCGILRKARLKTPMTLADFTELVKEKLNASHVIFCGDLNKYVSKIGICGGAGGSFAEDCTDCDVLLTGEAKYHEFQYGTENNLAIVAAGHFETENVTLYKIRDALSAMGITVKDGNFHESFCRII